MNTNNHYWSRFDKQLSAVYHLSIRSYIFEDLYKTKCGLVRCGVKGILLAKNPTLFDTQICRQCLKLANERESQITIVSLPK